MVFNSEMQYFFQIYFCIILINLGASLHNVTGKTYRRALIQIRILSQIVRELPTNVKPSNYTKMQKIKKNS